MGVTIRNPKTDSKSEFGGPKTVEERVGCARGTKWPKGLCMVATWGPREPHVDRVPLSTCGPRGPHVGTSQGYFGHFAFPSLFPLNNLFPSHFIFKKKEEKVKSRIENSLQFSQLPNTITFTYELGFEWFKLEVVHNRVLYLLQVVWGLFDRFFWGLYTENRTSFFIKGSELIFWISSFITLNYLGVSSSIYTCMFGECYWVI